MKNIIFFILYIVCNPKLILLYLKGIYIPSYIQYQWLKEYDINSIIDVGAYHGNVVNALHYLFPRAKIHAFEPLDENFKILSSHFSSKNILLNKIAISDKVGNAKFYRNNVLPASSLLSINPLAKKRYRFLSKETLTEVQTSTLDKYFSDKEIKKHVFLKIDTQGTELLVLKGAKKILDNVSILYLESSFGDLYKGQCSFDDIYQYLKSISFLYIGGSIADYGFYPFFELPRSENSIFINTRLINK